MKEIQSERRQADDDDFHLQTEDDLSCSADTEELPPPSAFSILCPGRLGVHLSLAGTGSTKSPQVKKKSV